MSAVSQWFYEELSGDPTLAGLLSSYGGQPAVFTAEPPAKAQLPYIVTEGHVSDVPMDTKTTRARDVLRDVRCYAEKDGDSTLIESIAERVREVLHRRAAALGAVEITGTYVSGPIAADEERAYGRVLTVRLHIGEI